MSTSPEPLDGLRLCVTQLARAAERKPLSRLERICLIYLLAGESMSSLKADLLRTTEPHWPALERRILRSICESFSNETTGSLDNDEDDTPIGPPVMGFFSR